MANVSKPLHAYYKSDVVPAAMTPYREHWVVIQHTLLTREWMWLGHKEQNRRTGEEEYTGFTCLKREYLNDSLTKRAATAVLTWALGAGHLVRDGHYIEGKKSFGYRLSDHLRSLPTRQRPITDRDLDARLKLRNRRDSKKFTKAQRHLRNWLEKIVIEDKAAKDVARMLCESNESLEANLGAITMLNDGCFTFSICDYDRCHTNLTRLARFLRPYLRVRVVLCAADPESLKSSHSALQPLVNIDIANSQPLFLGITMLTEVPKYKSQTHTPNQTIPSSRHQDQKTSTPHTRWQGGGKDDCNCMSGKDDMKQVKMPETTPGIERPVELEIASGDDLSEYIRTCSEGKLYAQIMQHMGWQGSKDESKRGVWFQFLYGSNKTVEKLSKAENENLRKLNASFQALYPSVYRWVWERKKKYYKGLACDMQRAEAKIMIDTVGSRLRDEYPQVPVFTIHDSYLTTEEYVPLVSKIILEAFAGIGVHPTLGVDHYAAEDHQNDHRDAPDADPRRDELDQAA